MRFRCFFFFIVAVLSTSGEQIDICFLKNLSEILDFCDRITENYKMEQIDLTKLSIQQLQQLKMEFESVSLNTEFFNLLLIQC